MDDSLYQSHLFFLLHRYASTLMPEGHFTFPDGCTYFFSEIDAYMQELDQDGPPQEEQDDE